MSLICGVCRFERPIPLKNSGTFGNVQRPTSNQGTPSAIDFNFGSSYHGFLAKKMAFMIDRMERVDILIQRSMLDVKRS